MKVRILFLTLTLIAATAMLWAGSPKACDDPEHAGAPPCNMKACAHYGKDGKPNGSRCSHYCNHKGICCKCTESCVGDPAYNPEDGTAFYKQLEDRLWARIVLMQYNDGLSSGRVD